MSRYPFVEIAACNVPLRNNFYTPESSVSPIPTSYELLKMHSRPVKEDPAL